MGLRIRRSMKIAPGVRMNIGKKGVGLSLGNKIVRCNLNPSGRQSVTFSLPGTGISYVLPLNKVAALVKARKLAKEGAALGQQPGLSKQKSAKSAAAKGSRKPKKSRAAQCPEGRATLV